MSERYDAYADLGGNIPSRLSPEEEQALYNIGLGNPKMRAKVEARNKASENAAQDAVNKAGAAAYRSAGVSNDIAKEIDVHSTEYLSKQKLAELNRTRRA